MHSYDTKKAVFSTAFNNLVQTGWLNIGRLMRLDELMVRTLCP